MLNIVIPMAGSGMRFYEAGYALPKPLIDVNGQTMIEIVIRNITPQCEHQFIFICQQQHLEQYPLQQQLETLTNNPIIISVAQVTQGAACTVLLAEQYINNLMPLMIANCDQYVDICIDDYLHYMDKEGLDGLIMTLTSQDPKWSYVGFDEQHHITRVVEKQVISTEATVGIYNYKHGSDFVTAANEMIKYNDRVNNEFYVAPVYNYFLTKKKKLGIYNIGQEGHGMYGLGVPEDLQRFLASDIINKLRNK
jgi:dTDP-glucose pyrophosphorylase